MRACCARGVPPFRFLVYLVLAIVVLAAHGTDSTQLYEPAVKLDGGIPTGGILWFYFVSSLLGGVHTFFTSFDKVAKFGPAFYIKDASVVPVKGLNGIMRVRGCDPLLCSEAS